MDDPELQRLNEKLKPLFKHWRPGAGPCPFVIRDEHARQVSVTHYDAGPDACYVNVSRKIASGRPNDPLSVTIDYAPAVEGTALIYDITAETMQGKARPFVCEFGTQLVRIFAILPFQIENASVRLQRIGKEQRLHIAFHEGRGETIRAALPLELRLPRDGGTSKYWATDPMGRCLVPLDDTISVSASQFVIRSLLTGLEYRITA